jgi:4-hydroxy-tetrahydrodipicolinate reductase
MGSTIIREASPDEFDISSAIEIASNPKVGMTLAQAGLKDSTLQVEDTSALSEALSRSDVCLSFTQPDAEVQNISVVAESGRPIVMGTTGLSQSQREKVESTIRGKIPAVISSNFSIGANTLFALAASMRNLPDSFDISVSEIHHSGKADAPSGTALRIGEILSKARGYSETVYGRSGNSKRKAGELEISSLRGGGVPGIHTVFAFGPNEMLKLEHTAFSRSAFATGALLAAGWISSTREARIYSMLDVLGFPT